MFEVFAYEAYPRNLDVVATVKADSYAHRYCIAMAIAFRIEGADTSVVLDRTTLSLKQGDAAFALTATVNPAELSDKLVWASSDEKVAAVSADGKVTAVAGGVAIITCTVDNGSGVQASCIVHVAGGAAEITTITLDKTTLSMKVGDADVTLKATVTPESSTAKLLWSSSDPAVATVSAGGVIKAVSGGVAIITCKVNDGSNAEASCIVTVSEETATTTVTLDQSALSMKVGGTSVTLKATVMPASSASKLVWTSSEPSIATVSNKGVVKAVSNGIVIITCKVNDGSNTQAHCIVTVNEDVLVEKITLNKSTATLNLVKGKKLELYARVSPINAANQNLVWRSSNSRVASVNSMGSVTPVGIGTAVITCTATDGSGKSASCTVTVFNDVKPTGIELSKIAATLNLATSETLNLTATVLPTNASYTSLSWRSSDPSVTTVSNGTVIPRSAGTTIITCTINGMSDIYAAAL